LTIDDCEISIRFAAHARAWNVAVDETRATETSQLGFGTCGGKPVVLKVLRQENGEEWRCGEILNAFGGNGIVLPLAHAPGAVLLPRLVPGYDLVETCLEGRDDEATSTIASIIQRMHVVARQVPDVRSVDGLQSDFSKYRHRGDGLIPVEFVDKAEALFGDLCVTQRNVRLLHGDLHHYNVLFDSSLGWAAIDPWGVMGEIEFEIGASLRNPVAGAVKSPGAIERRLRIYEGRLRLDADRALKWSFATTVLGILWPFDPNFGVDLRGPFAAAARSMAALL
jgi:streptomycin 6-kinase